MNVHFWLRFIPRDIKKEVFYAPHPKKMSYSPFLGRPTLSLLSQQQKCSGLSSQCGAFKGKVNDNITVSFNPSTRKWRTNLWRFKTNEWHNMKILLDSFWMVTNYKSIHRKKITTTLYKWILPTIKFNYCFDWKLSTSLSFCIQPINF